MSQKKVTFSCLHAYSTVSNRFNRFFFQDSHILTPDGRAVLVAILVLWKRPVPIVSDMYLSDIVSGFSILSVDTRFSTCGEWGRHSSWPHLHWWWEITTFNLVFMLLPHHPTSTSPSSPTSPTESSLACYHSWHYNCVQCAAAEMVSLTLITFL